MRTWLAALAVFSLAAPAAAAVADSQANGFEVVETQDIAAPPAAVYAAIGRIGDWWSSEHSYSHDTRNYHLDLVAGGCLCERLPDGGSAAHMRVILVEPNALIRLEGALGPLAASGGDGHLTWKLTAKGSTTQVVLTYDFGGYMKGGFADIAPAVDGVLGEQTARLKRYIETGRPDAPAS